MLLKISSPLPKKLRTSYLASRSTLLLRENTNIIFCVLCSLRQSPSENLLMVFIFYIFIQFLVFLFCRISFFISCVFFLYSEEMYFLYNFQYFKIQNLSCPAGKNPPCNVSKNIMLLGPNEWMRIEKKNIFVRVRHISFVPRILLSFFLNDA